MANQGPRKPCSIYRRRWSRHSNQEETRTESSSSSHTCPFGAEESAAKLRTNTLRLVLLGRTGAGKSASGNTLLGDECFDAEVSMGSVTKECKREHGTAEGRNLLLVDTPGLFDTELTTEQLQHELLHCLALCSPGPHVFLLVIPIERYTEEQQRTVDMIQEMFQQDIIHHTIIIFSHADRLNESIEEFISRQSKKIQELVEMFGKRYVAFDNTDRGNRDQVARLLEKVDEVLVKNNNMPFTSQVTEVVLKAKTIIDQRKRMKIKEEVQKEADERWAAFTADMKEDRKDSEGRKKRIQRRINQIEDDIKKEKQNAESIPERLKRWRASLAIEQKNLRRLEKEEKERIDQEQREKMNLDLWMNEEQQRRESQDTQNDSYYIQMIINLSYVLLGVGIASFAPVLLAFLFPAAPAVAEAGLAVQILSQMLHLFGEAVPVMATGLKITTLTRCTIQ